jgi:hypothetical protein
MIHSQLAEVLLRAAILDGGDRPPRPVGDTLSWLGTALAVVGLVSAMWGLVEATLRKRRLQARKTGLNQLELEFADRSDIRDEVELLVSSSPANSSNVTSRSLTLDAEAFAELRSQIAQLGRRVELQRSEIVEVHRIDPILEATLKLSVENLTKRVDAVERQALTRWDVALVFLQLLGGLGVIVSAVFATLKYLQK